MRVALVLAICVAAVAAAPQKAQKAAWGVATTIDRWPSMANLMYSVTGIAHVQECGGAIINQRSILTAANCFVKSGVVDPAWRWQARLGSSFRSSGGTVYNVGNILMHPSYNSPNMFDNDVALLQVADLIQYTSVIQFAAIGSYQIADYQPVWTTGWGLTYSGGSHSEQLQEVPIFTLNQAVCENFYSDRTITDGMLCLGTSVKDEYTVDTVDSRDHCEGDAGSPLYHTSVIVVGISSWGGPCGSFSPAVHTRVSHYVDWIRSNA